MEITWFPPLLFSTDSIVSEIFIRPSRSFAATHSIAVPASLSGRNSNRPRSASSHYRPSQSRKDSSEWNQGQGGPRNGPLLLSCQDPFETARFRARAIAWIESLALTAERRTKGVRQPGEGHSF